jgi:hypothetical protein
VNLVWFWCNAFVLPSVVQEFFTRQCPFECCCGFGAGCSLLPADSLHNCCNLDDVQVGVRLQWCVYTETNQIANTKHKLLEVLNAGILGLFIGLRTRYIWCNDACFNILLMEPLLSLLGDRPIAGEPFLLTTKHSLTQIQKRDLVTHTILIGTQLKRLPR